MQRRDFTKLLGGLAGTGLAGTAAAETDGFAPNLQEDPLEQIEILTTEYNESHIYGDSVYALGYGNGYVQARDRLFLLDAVRHIGYGNSAQVLGPAQLSSDIQVRRDLYSPDEIRRQWENASQTIKEAVRGYTDGVNRRMTEMAAAGELPGIFAALGHAPEPWKPEDTVAAINYLIGFFGVSGGSELGNAKSLARLKQNLGDEREAFEAYGDLNWLETTDDHFTSIAPGDEDYDPDLVETVPDYEDVPQEQLDLVDAALGAETWGIETDLSIPPDVQNGIRSGQGLMTGFKWGSNAYVFSGELTETGTPMLGGGPQMGFFKPPIPYEIGLHGAGFDMTGMGVVGAPALVIGRTDTLAWTVTSGRDDQIDTIAVELDTEDKHRYRWDGEWYEMSTETVVHRANPAGAVLTGGSGTRVVEQEVARVEQDGASMPVVAWNPDENIAWCQRTTTRGDELEGAFAWAELGRSDDLEDFEHRLSEFPFTFNFHVVEYEEDDQGNVERENIAYIHTGKIPERFDGRDYRLPATPETHEWTATYSGTGLGTTDRNSSRGYYVNWNNGPAAGWRAGDGEQNWGSRHRVETQNHFIRQKLDIPEGVPVGKEKAEQARSTVSLEDVRDIEYQSAKHDATAQVSAPYLRDAAADADDLQDVADVLTEWLEDFCSWKDLTDDDRMDYPGHSVFLRARKKLQQRVFDDELDGEQGTLDLRPVTSRHASDSGNATSDVTFIDALAGETEHDWFATASNDGLATFDPERRDEVIRGALREVKAELREEYGSDPADWRDAILESKFLSIGASNQTVIDIQNRSSYNQAIDMGFALSDDTQTWQDNAQDVLPPGQSGHQNAQELAQTQATGEEPERLHDQLEFYVNNGEYKPHPHTRTQVEDVAVESTTVRVTPEHDYTPVVPAAPRPLPMPISVPNPDGPSPGDTPAPPEGGVPSRTSTDRGDGSDATDTASDATDTASDATDTVDRPTGHVTDSDLDDLL
ncbi:penicillin acylase family protein [Haloglomus salinum]|uniref:penicillin acylase family protein n=1 Tax=Haloglomus salinum TaxID=2962673 RepID=UPI0020C96875|nr:penicillin acylase family protein [Haloglomus salinum]